MYRPLTDLPLLESYGKLTCPVDWSEFPYDPESPGSKDAALRAFDEHAIAMQSAIEKNLGRPLTNREMMRGVEHVEDQSVLDRERTKDQYATVFAEQKEVEPNPFKRLLAKHKAELKRERDPKGAWMEEEAEKWDAERAEEEHRAKMAADPRRQTAVKHAVAELSALRFDHRVPASEIRAAEFRLQLAKQGDLKMYEHEVNEYQKRHCERLEKLAQPHLEGIRAHVEERKRLRQPFSLPIGPPVSNQATTGDDPFVRAILGEQSSTGETK